MRTMRQLLRQPMKTLFGVILIATAVAVLCVCLGQSIAAKDTEQRLNNIFLTLALPSADYSAEADQWAMEYAATHPEVVKSVKNPGLISAYIPELRPDNYTSHLDLTDGNNDNYLLLPDLNGQEYRSVMMEITLTELGIPSSQWTYLETDTRGMAALVKKADAPEAGVYVSYKGVIENVIGLAEGYQDPTGFTVSSTLYMPSLEDLEALDLRVGERYLVYSTDYSDEDWWIRSYMTQQLRELDGKLFDAFETDRLTVLSEEEVIRNIYNEQRNDIVAKYRFDGLIHGISRWEFDYVRSIRLFQMDTSAMPNFTWEKDEHGNPMVVLLDYQTYLGKNGETVTVTPEEYYDRYREPTMVHLDGSAEEFLASEEGELWREALYNVQVNSHAFPMICVDDMTEIVDYVEGKAEIVEGRDFTNDELIAGERVCILSQSLANLNGLTVGDSITVQLYENDPGVPYQINISEGEGSVNPVAYYYFDNTMELEEPEEYTIIGIYQQDIEWGNVDDNLYAFTPNTVFIPKASVTARMDDGYAAFFRTFFLENGTVEEFQQAAAEAGFESMLYFNDHGYSTVEDSLLRYGENAGRAMGIGLAVYAILMALYIVLFPAQQRNALNTMVSLGADRGTRMGHLLSGSLCLILPGTVLGTAAGMLLWQKMVDMLTDGNQAVLGIQTQNVSLVIIGITQMLLAMGMVALLAIPMTRGRSLMKRK